MSDKETVRVNFDFPKSKYPYLKFLCAQKGLSIREFMTTMVLREIEEAEELLLGRISDERISSRTDDDLMDWDEATKMAGWE